MPKSTCRACGAVFGGLRGFEAHRVGRYMDDAPHYGRCCLPSDELLELGFIKKQGIWRRKIKNLPVDWVNTPRQALTVAAEMNATEVPATYGQGNGK